MKRIVLHIDRLVLSGFSHESAGTLAEDIRQGLLECLSQPELSERLPNLTNQARIRGKPFRLTQDKQSTQLGFHLAHVIVNGGKP
jgi:hypothetical protein